MKKVSLKLPTQGNGWGTVNTKYPKQSVYVASDELTGSSKNFDTDSKGLITKRSGGVNYNSTSFTNPSNDAYEAVFSDGVRHLLSVDSGVLRYSSGDGSFHTVSSSYSAIGNFEFSMYNDRVYFGNGIDNSQVYDRTASYGGVSYSVPQVKDMGAQAPSSAPSVAISAGGSVPVGGHTYKITYLYYDSEESNGSTSSALATTTVGNQTVDLTSIPVGGYGVTARKIYRDDNDGVYRLVATILNNTATTYSDTAAVGTALIPTDNNEPEPFKYIVTHLDRTWIAGISGDPSVLRYSEAGLPNIFPSDNELVCNPKDPITALVVFNDRVIVFNRNSVGQILGRTSDQFRYSEIPGDVGCGDNRSIQTRTVTGVPTLIWLSQGKGVWSFNGSSVNYLSDPIEDKININLQQGSQVRGSNSQSTQSQFQAGTATPGIDLTSIPGTITTPNPKRLWDDETDWEGGSSLTNVATNLTSNKIQVPTKHAPAFSDGTHSNTEEVSGNLTIAGGAGENNLSVPYGGGFFVQNTAGLAEKVAQKIVPLTSGTISSVTFNYRSNNLARNGLIKIYADSGLNSPALPVSAPLYTSATFVTAAVPAGGPDGMISIPVSLSVTAGTAYWISIECTGTASPVLSTGTFAVGYSSTQSLFNPTGSTSPVQQYFSGPNTWTPAGGVAGLKTLSMSYAVTVTAAGQWTGPIYDSKSDSAISATISHTGTFPSGTTGTTTIEASNDPLMVSGVVTTTATDLNGSSAAVLSSKRYWRIKINLYATAAPSIPTVGAPTLRFNQTATWISEAIDHTTDITTLNSLSMASNTPSGTTATLEIATSADNITYSSYTALGSATPQRYSKIRITMTSDSDNAVTPDVTSVLLTWTLVSNLQSSAIDTGSTPAGWDAFQAAFDTNGGTVVYQIRSGSSLVNLAAASYVTVTSGSFPGIPVNQYVQWKSILTSTADNVPEITSVTVNWYISNTNAIRAASLFYNRAYFLAGAEQGQTVNNIVFKYDQEGKWRIYRGININTLVSFFDTPYYGSATDGKYVKFLESDTDRGTPIEMVVETKAFDMGEDLRTKVCRKLYFTGLGTGAVYTPEYSVDGGTTYIGMINPQTGLTSYTTASDGKPFYVRFVPSFALGQETSGNTISFRITENTAAQAQLETIQAEAWVRNGEVI